MWGMVSGHWSAWQAARVEVQQQAEAQAAQENPVEDRVVEKLVEETILRAVNPDGPLGASTLPIR